MPPQTYGPDKQVLFKRALVTGAAGCIGRCLTKRLVSEGYQVNAFDMDESGLRSLIAEIPPGAVTSFVGNLGDGAVIQRATEDVEVVFHAAAKVHVIPRSAQDETEFFRVNVEGTENLLEACSETDLRSFLFFSTIAVYGTPDRTRICETTPLHPENAYAKSKLEAEERVRDFFHGRAIKPAIFRMSLVYGEGERGNFSRMLRTIDSGRFVLVGGGMTLKSMIYVGDVAHAAWLATTQLAGQGETFVLSDPDPYTVRQIAEAIARHLGRRPPWIRLPAGLLRVGGATVETLGRIAGFKPPFTRLDIDKLLTDTRCDISKIQRVLGYRPRYGLDEGVRRTVKWFRDANCRNHQGF